MTAEAAAGGLPAGYAIRERRTQDDAILLRVENRAAELFRTHGYPDIADNPFASVEDMRAMMQGHDTWVAVDGSGMPVGYAVAGPLGAHVHLRELSVDPDHGRKGLGAALVRTVIAAAASRGAAGVSLTTFRDVPFNMPFYEKLGFAEIALDDAPAALLEAFHRELPPGTDPAARVLMLRRSR